MNPNFRNFALGDHYPARRCAGDAVSKSWAACAVAGHRLQPAPQRGLSGHVREVTIAGNEITGH